MSVKVTGMVFERYSTGGGEMLLALALADHAHDDGTHIFPSIARLAAKTRQSERSVQYQLRRMEACGWLILVNAGTGGRSGETGRTREYRINPAWMKGAEIAPIKTGGGNGGKGAKAAPFGGAGKGATDDEKGCKTGRERVQNGARKGAKLLHPNQEQPKATISEPSSSAQERGDDDGTQLTADAIATELAGLSRIPESIDRQVLARFVRHRRVGRRPLSISSWLELLPRFAELRSQGHDLNESLRQTMAAGLFLPVTPSARPKARSTDDAKRPDESFADYADRLAQQRRSQHTGWPGGADSDGQQPAGADDVIDAEWRDVAAAG